MGRSEDFTAETFRFDEFELDVPRRTLRRAGADVELRPLAFDALGVLVRHAGRVVTKDELIAAVWPGLVVTDDSIARCISDIRRALGDAEQRIVKTVPRRGYTVAVPVAAEVAAPATGSATSSVDTITRISCRPVASATASRIRRRWWRTSQSRT